MMESEILDQSFHTTVKGSKYVNINRANGAKRFANLLIDLIAYFILSFIAGVILGIFITSGVAVTAFTLQFIIPFLVYALYYFIMEYSFGKTIGKMITRTKVLTTNGAKPGAGAILGRTFSRFIPFEAFSFLGDKAIGWHDSISGTRVVNDE